MKFTTANGGTVSLTEVTLITHSLGDSGFVILQPGKIAFASEPQTHAFNTPYQLAKLPPRDQQQHAIFGGGKHYSELPAQSDVTTHAMKTGDVTVLFSDGVGDNLSAMDILAVVGPIMEKQGFWKKGAEARVDEVEVVAALGAAAPQSGKEFAAQLAYAVMREAKLASVNPKRDGPFAKEVQKYYPREGWHGGKEDDIAVVVAVAVQDGAEPAPKAKL